MARIMHLDSTDLHWNPDIGSTYSLAGKQLKVDSPGLENPWYALFGSLIFPSGEGLYTIHHRKRAAELLEHLQLLIDLELVYLPTYSPHLNLIERLWRLMRSQVTRNRFYDSLSALADVTVNWLDQLPFAQFCSLLGMNERQLAFVNKPFS